MLQFYWITAVALQCSALKCPVVSVSTTFLPGNQNDSSFAYRSLIAVTLVAMNEEYSLEQSSGSTL